MSTPRCIRGHEYVAANTYWSSGRRRCRACTLEWQRLYRQGIKQGRMEVPRMCRCGAAPHLTPSKIRSRDYRCKECYYAAAAKRRRSNGKKWGQTRIAVRFWEKVTRSNEGCWTWQGSRNESGYGVLLVRGRKLVAHRVSWEVIFGPVPDGMLVLHRCDNPPCVRPDHLFIGTHMDNIQDCIAKGRRHYQKAAALVEE